MTEPSDIERTCLSDEALLAFVEHRSEKSERDRMAQHLETCEECQGLLGLLQSRDDTGVPKQIDRFVVMRQLGRGAMGVVYLAYDPKLERRVAIKVLAHANAALGAQIEREARALARLNHPNVVSVYDVGTHEGQVFMAMEFVDGTTLRAWVTREKRTRAALLDALLQAGEGLLVAHRAGVVHRDFKPDNILIGSDARVRVVDFGLAQSSHMLAVEHPVSERDAVLSLTQTGTIVGTPAYMAPEQYRSGTVDARTDQFAFGIVVAELIYGRRPFEGRSFDELSEMVTQGAFVLPNDRTGLSPIVRRCLAVSKDARYPSMLEVLRDLRIVSTQRKPIPRRFIATAVVVVGAVAAGFGFRSAKQPSVVGEPQEVIHVTGSSAVSASEPSASAATLASVVPSMTSAPTAVPTASISVRVHPVFPNAKPVPTASAAANVSATGVHKPPQPPKGTNGAILLE